MSMLLVKSKLSQIYENFESFSGLIVYSRTDSVAESVLTY